MSISRSLRRKQRQNALKEIRRRQVLRRNLEGKSLGIPSYSQVVGNLQNQEAKS